MSDQQSLLATTESATRIFDISPTSSKHYKGEIVNGWLMLNYGPKAVLLLGRGDYIDTTFIDEPLSARPLCPTKIDAASPPPSGPFWSQRFGRHTARLTAQAAPGMADLILELAEKEDPENTGPTTIDLPLSQWQIGELLGLSAVHVNRTLMQLSRTQIIAHRKGQVTVLDRSGLQSLAERVYC